MKFEFNTEIDGPKEATALATALTVLYGGTIATALDNALQSLEDAPVTSDSVHLTDQGHEDAVGDTSVEPSAAEAFGGNETFVGTATDQRPRDKDGIPWDARIHSGNKGTNKDGTWTRRRNTADEFFDRVMAELKTGVIAETPTPQTTQTVPPPPPPQPSAETMVPPPPPAPTETAPAASAAPTTNAPAAASSAPITFPILMVKITKLQSAGKIDKATVDGFLNAFDMKEAKELAKATPDTIAAVNAMVDGYVGD